MDEAMIYSRQPVKWSFADLRSMEVIEQAKRTTDTGNKKATDHYNPRLLPLNCPDGQ